MKRALTACAAALALSFGAVSAQAVDVINQDSQDHHVTTIGDGGFAQLFEIPAGQTVKGICEECTVVLGKGFQTLTDEPAVNAADKQTVMIKDGKVKVQ